MQGMDQQAMVDMAIAQSMLQVEAALDDELNRIDNLGEDDLAKIKANRVAEMRKHAEEEKSNRAKGHGSLMQVEQKDFFEATKNSDRVICILTRNSNKYGKQLLEHCEILAQRHMEARFIWVDAENAPFLTDKLNIYMLPTVCCIKNNKVHKQHNGMNDIDGSGKYSTGTLEYLLHTDEMLNEAPLYDKELERQAEEDESDIDD